ncbi:MAG TPA: bidirectional hydrogenase complex protein HoxU [Candidatus Sumerlaeota bacterium]|nr:bidirectional hydrogenase complex protein HoxU [Candidatus Sumerlaeota bacterium]HPK04107.1 bidirectional hydrogenase complex protein HoxU [Candidatus Sumerlaeota bacterium]
MDRVNLKINGQPVQARAGQSLLAVARDNGIDIPTLCHLDGLSGVGACRLCLVEVAGVGRLLPACTTPVQHDMDVRTDSPRLARYRRMILELLFSERNHVCAVCVSNGHCDLQAMAQSQGMTHVRFPYLYPPLKVDASHRRYVLDHNRCILCTRCVRVCAEVEGAHMWDVMSRGVHSRLVAELNQPWGDSQVCTSCGKCVAVCPTGALAEKGRAVGEMQKPPLHLTDLALLRGGLS